MRYEPVGRDNVRAGALLAFGEVVERSTASTEADVILSLDADFVGERPASLRLIREFAARRKVEGEKAAMNRLYVVESTPYPHRRRRPIIGCRCGLGAIEGLARAVAAGLGLAGRRAATTDHADWVGPLVKDLQAPRRRGRW